MAFATGGRRVLVCKRERSESAQRNQPEANPNRGTTHRHMTVGPAWLPNIEANELPMAIGGGWRRVG